MKSPRNSVGISTRPSRGSDMVRYEFDEETDYGQDILVLMGEVASLMEEGRLYSKTEINSTLIRIKNRAANIQHEMAGKDKDTYFTGIDGSVKKSADKKRKTKVRR